MRRIGPSAEPTAPTPAKNASRAKSYPPGSAAREGGSRRALSSTKSPAATSGVVAGRHPDPARNLVSRHAVGGVDADHHARADGPQVDFLDKALERDDADAVEHRRSDPRRAQRHRQETGEQRRDGQRKPERQRPGAAEPRERAEESDHQRRQPQDGLPVGRQIGRDASHRRDRNP